MIDDPWERQRAALGSYIRSQRKLANLSLRQLADIAKVSNPYLSQIERGLHAPSVRVLRSIAEALDLSAETLLEQAGLLEHANGGQAAPATPPTERAIRIDPRLTESQKEALISVYRSYVAAVEGDAS
ncbi:MAG: helix-turn-helix domain-containing protein [Actinobacteria bacterium]|nr:helix-turn-helix domain-containing protein [Actinomycetota bacterium]